nr:hypothetical protein GCM10020092_040750 [Actinoplanes digitatis]
MIELKSAEEIGRMAVASRFVGELLAELGDVAEVGVNLMDLEHHARRRIKERGAESCYWDYAPRVRPRPVPQRAVPVGERRGAARAAARLRVARR